MTANTLRAERTPAEALAEAKNRATCAAAPRMTPWRDIPPRVKAMTVERCQREIAELERLGYGIVQLDDGK